MEHKLVKSTSIVKAGLERMSAFFTPPISWLIVAFVAVYACADLVVGSPTRPAAVVNRAVLAVVLSSIAWALWKAHLAELRARVQPEPHKAQNGWDVYCQEIKIGRVSDAAYAQARIDALHDRALWAKLFGHVLQRTLGYARWLARTVPIVAFWTLTALALFVQSDSQGHLADLVALPQASADTPASISKALVDLILGMFHVALVLTLLYSGLKFAVTRSLPCGLDQISGNFQILDQAIAARLARQLGHDATGQASYSLRQTFSLSEWEQQLPESPHG